MAKHPKIQRFSHYGDPRKQAEQADAIDVDFEQRQGQRQASNDENPHGMTPDQIQDMHRRFEAFEPGLYRKGDNRKQIIQDLLDERVPGGSVDVVDHSRSSPWRRQGQVYPGGGQGGYGNGVLTTPQRPYQPEYESQDRQCFVEGTLVKLADGTQKPIEDIEPGEKVLDGKGHISLVEDQWCEGVPNDLIEIKVWGGRKFLCTPNHKWPVWKWVRECQCGCGSSVKSGKCFKVNHHRKKTCPPIRLVHDVKGAEKSIPEGYQPIHKLDAADIYPGDLLLMPRRFDEKVTEVTSEQARLLGYYVAEGCPINHGYSTKFALNVTERDTLAKDIMDLCREEGIESRIYEELHCNGITVLTSSDIRAGGEGKARALQTWLHEHAGEGSPTKRLSGAVMSWPVNLKAELLRGMFCGDGCQRWRDVNDKQGRSFSATYGTTSPMLAHQISTILNQLGFAHRTYSKEAFTDPQGGNHKKSYQIETNGNTARQLARSSWHDWSKSEDDEVKISHAGPMIDDDFIYVKVKSVKRLSGRNLRVYNLSVSGDHSYQVSGIATFNSYPIHRLLANRYWRLFYKMDPLISTCVNLKANLLWSDFQISGEGVDGSIKDSLESMCEQTQLRSMLPYFSKEYDVIGEVGPHLFHDKSQGIWTHIAFHNPDQLEIIHSPFLNMEPIAEFVPDDKLRQIVTSPNPMLRRVREMLPPELVAKLSARQNIALNPLNFTFIARKLHPYDVRGTSLISAMWRVNMAEDCFVAGTPVSLPDGTIKPIDQVEIGDKVLDRKGGVETVTNVVIKSGTTRKIKISGGLSFECTLTHKWPVWVRPRTCTCGCGAQISIERINPDDGRRRWTKNAFIRGHGGSIKGKKEVAGFLLPSDYQSVRKIEAKDLQVGDFLMVPRHFVATTPTVSLDFARLLGYYTAEGSVTPINTNGRQLRFSLHSDEAETLAKDIMSICSGLGVESHLYIDTTGRRACHVAVHKNEFVWLSDKLIEFSGQYSSEKVLSSEVMGWPIEYKKQFLAGYIAGDGSYQISPQILASAATTSKSLDSQLFLLFAQVGWPVRRSKYQPLNSDGCNRFPMNRWALGGRSADELIAMVFGYEVKRSKKQPNPWSENWVDDDHVYYLVKDIKDSLEEKNVYGLTVSGDHSYLVNGIATYNSLWNSFLATSRRASRPLKVVKLGDPSTNWIPGPEQEQKMLRLLAQAETDPEAAIITHFGANFELWGEPTRSLNISNTYDLIERIKLVALGVSKSMITGDASYANAAAGLTVFLQELLSKRELFEDTWLYPKFFKPIAVMNKWVKPTQAEVGGKGTQSTGPFMRTRRSHKEIVDDRRYIIPTIEWEKSLDPAANTERIQALATIQESLGIKVSKRTILSTVGLDYEAELKQIKNEVTMVKDIVDNNLEVAAAAGITLPGMAPAAPGGEGGGGGGAPNLSVSPGLPPGSMGEFGPDEGGEAGGEPGGTPGEPPAGDEAAPPPGPEGASKHGGDDVKDGKPKTPAPKPMQSSWPSDALKSAHDMFDHFDYADVAEPWDRFIEDSKPGQIALKQEDGQALWEAMSDWLIDEGYPTRAITELEDSLTGRGKVVRAAIHNAELLDRLEAQLLGKIESPVNGKLVKKLMH